MWLTKVRTTTNEVLGKDMLGAFVSLNHRKMYTKRTIKSKCKCKSETIHKYSTPQFL